MDEFHVGTSLQRCVIGGWLDLFAYRRDLVAGMPQAGSIMCDRPPARAVGTMCRDHDAAVTLSQVKVATTCAAEINHSAHVRRNGG
jgi:hypothetical protein